MAYANLNKEGMEINGFDSIIIKKDLGDVDCGVTLDVSSFPDNVVKAGHLLIQNDTTKAVSPLNLNSDGNAYVNLPNGSSYYGINKTSVMKSLPMVGVLRIGIVNAAAAKNAIGAEYPAAAKAALKMIDFQ